MGCVNNDSHKGRFLNDNGYIISSTDRLINLPGVLERTP